MHRIKGILNIVRNILIFKLRYPWVRHGKNIHCQWSVRISPPNYLLVMGDNVGIGYNCIIDTDTIIGNNILIASHVGLLGRDSHTYDKIGKSIFESPRGDNKKIVIENDVWIGFGAIILSGVRIGNGSIIAAGSVVVKDVEPYSIVASPGATKIGDRFTAEEIQKHENIINQISYM